MARVRDFDPLALLTKKSPKLRASFNARSSFQGKAWEFQLFLPRWLIINGARTSVCTVRDQNFVRQLLETDFGGYTSEPSFPRGVGYRDEALEVNLHRKFTVIASRWRGTMKYFNALRRELEACSGEEQILILRQELYII